MLGLLRGSLVGFSSSAYFDKWWRPLLTIPPYLIDKSVLVSRSAPCAALIAWALPRAVEGPLSLGRRRTQVFGYSLYACCHVAVGHVRESSGL